MGEEIIFKVLANIGVPAAVCFYTLVEVNRSVKRLAESIDRFNLEFDRRIDKLNDEVTHRIEKLEEDVHALTVEIKSHTNRGDYHDLQGRQGIHATRGD